MRLSLLQKTLNNAINLSVFKTEIEGEVEQYKIHLRTIGGSSPIILVEDIENLEIKSHHIIFICDHFLKGNLNKWHLNYIAEALLLSEKVIIDNTLIQDALYALTDSEFFLSVNSDYIKNIIAELNN